MSTFRTVLRPGFHSGPVPKLFARLRRTDGGRARKREEALHHVGEDIQKFVERDLLAVLAGSRSWGGEKLALADIHLATNRIRIRLGSSSLGVNSCSR